MSNEQKTVITPDRVNVSVGRKINVGNYQSVDLYIGYGSDVASTEKPEDCFKRVEKQVVAELDKFLVLLGGRVKKEGK